MTVLRTWQLVCGLRMGALRREDLPWVSRLECEEGRMGKVRWQIGSGNRRKDGWYGMRGFGFGVVARLRRDLDLVSARGTSVPLNVNAVTVSTAGSVTADLMVRSAWGSAE